MTDEVETGAMDGPMMDAFLAQPHMARMATSDPKKGRPHVVPVWYYWDGQAIWVSSFEDTRKIKDLKVNPFCSIVIDEAQSGVDYQAILMEGTAELIQHPAEFVQEMTTRIYARYLGDEEVNKPRYQEWIRAPENLVLRMQPEKLRAWYSAGK